MLEPITMQNTPVTREFISFKLATLLHALATRHSLLIPQTPASELTLMFIRARQYPLSVGAWAIEAHFDGEALLAHSEAGWLTSASEGFQAMLHQFHRDVKMFPSPLLHRTPITWNGQSEVTTTYFSQFLLPQHGAPEQRPH